MLDELYRVTYLVIGFRGSHVKCYRVIIPKVSYCTGVSPSSVKPEGILVFIIIGHSVFQLRFPNIFGLVNRFEICCVAL